MCSLRVGLAACAALGAVLLAPLVGRAEPLTLDPAALEARLADELPELPRGVDPATLRDFYAARDHAPLWLNADVPRAQTLLNRLDAAERQGLRAGTMFWVGSEADIGGVAPTYRVPYDGSISYEDRVDQAAAELEQAGLTR